MSKLDLQYVSRLCEQPIVLILGVVKSEKHCFLGVANGAHFNLIETRCLSDQCAIQTSRETRELGQTG